MKLVAVSQRMDFLQDREETRDSLDQSLSRFIIDSGNIPIPVPNGLAKKDENSGLIAWLKEVAPQAILLSGGNDLGEFVLRDITESSLIKYAEENSFPLLGICRGLQMIAQYYGAALKKVDGHVRTRHSLAGEVSWTVNSFHNLSISQCPNNFEVFASSEDGEIEGIKHKKLSWEGWMWHPEREDPFRLDQVERAKKLFSG